MMLSTRRSPSRIDVCNYHTLLYRDYDAKINFTTNCLLSQSPPPMTYRDLRSVMSNLAPSNVVILDELANPSQIITRPCPTEIRRKQSFRKKHKRQSVNVYRTLPRSESRCSRMAERDFTNDEVMLLANSFFVDHPSPSSANGFFHPQNLPNIQKHRVKTENSQAKTTNTSSPSLRVEHTGQVKRTPVDIQYKENINRAATSHTKPTSASPSISRIQHLRYTQPTSPQLIHRTTPVDIQYEEISHMTVTTTTTTTTTTDSSPPSETPARKQLHVYMPQIVSC